MSILGNSNHHQFNNQMYRMHKCMLSTISKESHMSTCLEVSFLLQWPCIQSHLSRLKVNGVLCCCCSLCWMVIEKLSKCTEGTVKVFFAKSVVRSKLYSQFDTHTNSFRWWNTKWPNIECHLLLTPGGFIFWEWAVNMPEQSLITRVASCLC